MRASIFSTPSSKESLAFFFFFFSIVGLSYISVDPAYTEAIQTDITAGMKIRKEINPKLKREYKQQQRK